MKSESKRKKQQNEIYDVLNRVYGSQKCCLDHETPFQLLVATILSAQCTDKKVNAVTPALFARFPDVRAFAAASVREIETMIHACGFFRAKAAHIVDASKAIVERFNGEVPADMDSLCSLPGVGRKTANVVLGDAFGIPGLPVDTHVKRIVRLTGLANTDDAEKIEYILCGFIPPENWAQFSHLLIMHGRNRCVAGKPDCAHCEICPLCGSQTKRKQKSEKIEK